MKMDMFEKVEKLRDRANVTFEEAKTALEESGGDLLDAMVYLEKQGKVKKPEQSTYSTSYEEQEQYESVEDKVKSQPKSTNVFEAIRYFIKGFVDKCRGNYFCMERGGEVKFKIPVLAFVIILLAFWKITIPAMIILLFFGCRFSFYGKDELKEVNNFMNKASDLAQQVKDGLKKDNDTETAENEENKAE